MAFGHGQLDERFVAIEKELEQNPNDPRGYFQLAQLNVEEGDWAQALIQLSRVDELAPAQFSTDLLRSDALLAAGRVELAKAMLDRFLAAHPTHAGAWLQRARVLKRMGAGEDSLTDYRAAWSRIASPEPDLVQEVSEAMLTEGHRDDAVQVLNDGLEKLGAIPSLVLRILDLEISAGNFDGALARVDAMQRQAPRPEPWMARRATILAQANRVAESRAVWQEIIDHLATLPELERGSHAMCLLAEEAHQALSAVAVQAAGSPEPPHQP